MNSWSTPSGGSINTATRLEMPLCTRSAASSAPAPSESSDKTMMSAEATGSFTTSAHPAARRTGSRRERIATIANAATASTTTIEAHLGHLKIILGFIRLLHESAMSPTGEHRPCSAKMASRCWRVRRDGGRHPRRRHSGPRSSVSTLIQAKGSATKPYSHICMGRQLLPRSSFIEDHPRARRPAPMHLRRRGLFGLTRRRSRVHRGEKSGSCSRCENFDGVDGPRSRHRCTTTWSSMNATTRGPPCRLLPAHRSNT